MKTEYEADLSPVYEIEHMLEKGSVKLNLVLLRHGPKKEAMGEKNELADNFAENVHEGLGLLDIKQSDRIRLASSPAPRAEATAKVAEEKFEGRVKVRPILKKLGSFENLGVELQKELDILIEYQKGLESELKQKLEGKPQGQEMLKTEIDNTILENMFNGTLDKLGQQLKLTRQLNLTSKDFSLNLEEYTKGIFRHINLLKSPSQPVSLNISHSYPIMSFLKENLKFIENEKIIPAKNIEGREFLGKVGGVIKEAEGLTLRYIQDGDKKIIKVEGNDYSGFIDYE